MTSHDPGDEGAPDSQDAPNGANGSPTKTPMYKAIHAPRYHRQALMKSIEDEWSCRLICYVSGKAATIDRDDIVGFVEMLHNIEPETNIDLLLHTRGGDVDAAEKMMTLVQGTVGAGKFRVIIPDFAKSAGTLMVLGADKQNFTMAELSKGFGDAKESPPANKHRDIGSAIKRGWIAPRGKDAYYVTSTGITAIGNGFPKVPRKRRLKKKKTSSKSK